MKSQIKTVDAVLAEEKSYPVKNTELNNPVGIAIAVLGFRNVQYKEKLQRPISKIMNPSNIINEH